MSSHPIVIVEFKSRPPLAAAKSYWNLTNGRQVSLGSSSGTATRTLKKNVITMLRLLSTEHTIGKLRVGVFASAAAAERHVSPRRRAGHTDLVAVTLHPADGVMVTIQAVVWGVGASPGKGGTTRLVVFHFTPTWSLGCMSRNSCQRLVLFGLRGSGKDLSKLRHSPGC